ncbi:hypothetical protein RIF29_15199 [Crotalaria pallida]|uniref:Uncharacterized protein n=1 Tax=Crotalaria pallida TaxID=3830 RepID=A0AAN9FJQ4_CROPI
MIVITVLIYSEEYTCSESSSHATKTGEVDALSLPLIVEHVPGSDSGKNDSSREVEAGDNGKMAKHTIRGHHQKNPGVLIGATSPVLGYKRKDDDGATGQRAAMNKEFEPNKRPMGDENIQCRLGRAVVTGSFLDQAQASLVYHLPRIQSDHAPIIIQMIADSAEAIRPKQARLFRFEEAWTFSPGTEATIKAAWQQAHGDGCDKTGAMKSMLKCLSRNTVTSLRREIIKVKQALSSNTCWEADATSLMKFKDLKERHASLLQEEEIMWRQGSRALWLQHGDKNSKFFHRKANQRRETNTIKKIKHEDGNIVTRQSNIAEVGC